MPTQNKNSKSFSKNSAVAFIDYKPAEIRIGKQYLIVYYAKNPISHKLERFRVNVPVVKNKVERKKIAVKMQLTINEKLAHGWLPYFDNVDNDYKTFEFVAEKFINQFIQDVESGAKRTDTLRSYRSYLNVIKSYIDKNKIDFIFEFNKSYVFNLLDWVIYERKGSNRTYNNYITFLHTFIQFAYERGYIKENFVKSIRKKPVELKKRKILTPEIKAIFKNHFENENNGFYTLCMTTYYCFIRRTELTKLKVGDVNFESNLITITSDISKNRKTESITIPLGFLPLIKKHVEKAKPDDFVFSKNFMVGKTKLKPQEITDFWDKFRKVYNISNEYQFYSLKDTGITDLLNTGVPALKVRNQARHGEIKMTEKYTERPNNCDTVIKENKRFKF